MTTFVEILVTAVIFAALYALMSVGMTLVYGVMRTFNMAHGTAVMLGGFVAWTVIMAVHWSPWAGLPVAFAAVSLIGVLLHAVSVKPLIKRSGEDFEMITFISTFAIAVVVTNLVLLAFGPSQRPVTPLVQGQLTVYAGVTISYQFIAIAVVSAVLLLVLGLFLQRTRYGLAIVAVAQQQDAASLSGVPVAVVHSLTFALGAGLAGVAGLFLAPVYYVYPQSGQLPLLEALTVAILGGLGSISGTVLAACLVGIVQAVVSVFLGVDWYLPVLYGVIILLLAIRPYGLRGTPQEERL